MKNVLTGELVSTEEKPKKRPPGRPAGAHNKTMMTWINMKGIHETLIKERYNPFLDMIKRAKGEGEYENIPHELRYKAAESVLSRVLPKLKAIEHRGDANEGSEMNEFKSEMMRLLDINRKDF